jgi:catalase
MLDTPVGIISLPRHSPRSGRISDMDDEQARWLVDAMEYGTGTLPGYRRAYARGIVFHAMFTPSDTIRDLTTAEHFQGPAVPTLVRLSNGSGNPHAPDKRPGNRGAVLGLAVRFALASGGHSTWAAANIEAFPARTAQEFIRLNRLQRPSPRTGKPKTIRLLAFLLHHRDLLPAFKSLYRLKPPESFATTRFNGLHTYYLVAADGTRRAFRYSWIPDDGCRVLSVRAQRELPPQYLISEIKQRPIASWTLEFTMGNHDVPLTDQPGDPSADKTKQPPKEREQVIAGRLELVKPHEDQASMEQLLFDPANVVSGIELSDDPILQLRSAVYAVSLERRILESRPTIVNE